MMFVAFQQHVVNMWIHGYVDTSTRAQYRFTVALFKIPAACSLNHAVGEDSPGLNGLGINGVLAYAGRNPTQKRNIHYSMYRRRPVARTSPSLSWPFVSGLCSLVQYACAWPGEPGAGWCARRTRVPEHVRVFFPRLCSTMPWQRYHVPRNPQVPFKRDTGCHCVRDTLNRQSADLNKSEWRKVDA